MLRIYREKAEILTIAVVTVLLDMGTFNKITTLYLLHFSCIQLCNLMYYCSMPDLPVHHHLPEFTQTHVH